MLNVHVKGKESHKEKFAGLEHSFSMIVVRILIFETSDVETNALFTNYTKVQLPRSYLQLSFCPVYLLAMCRHFLVNYK